MSTSNESLLILNGEEYEFDIVLSNPDKTWILPKSFFNSLSITEQVFDWEVNGTLEYKNDFEQVERIKASKTKKNSELFYFRMDGTDRIDIYLKPTFSSSQSSVLARNAKKMPIFDDVFLKISGSIYDTEDLFPGNIQQKSKRIYFWGTYFNSAIEKVMPFSSGEYLMSKKIESKNLPDKVRSVETGTLLKFLIEDKIGAKTSKTKWNVGVNKIIYTAPANYTLNDSIDYLVESHVDVESCPAILMFNRFREEFELVSYSDLFSGYPTALKEVFSFPDSTNAVVPIGPDRALKDNTYNFGSFSLIKSYMHTKMAGMDSMKAINSKSVNWYDPISSTFKTSMVTGSATFAKEKFKNLVSKFKMSRATPMFVLNKTKTTNMSMEHRYISGAYKSGGAESIGLCHTLRGALFLNDCITFESDGLPHRSAGGFIEISSEKDLQGVWEDRFLGAWFVTEVTHNITNSSYTNKFVCVKPNATESFTVPENV